MPRFVGPDGVTTIPVSVDNPLPVTFDGGEGPSEQVEVTNFPAVQDVELPSVEAATARTRVTTATTTPIAAGAYSYSVKCDAASSASSPTLDGVRMVLGEVVVRVAPPGGTLEAASLVTATGDDVTIDEVR